MLEGRSSVLLVAQYCKENKIQASSIKHHSLQEAIDLNTSIYQRERNDLHSLNKIRVLLHQLEVYPLNKSTKTVSKLLKLKLYKRMQNSPAIQIKVFYWLNKFELLFFFFLIFLFRKSKNTINPVAVGRDAIGVPVYHNFIHF